MLDLRAGTVCILDHRFEDIWHVDHVLAHGASLDIDDAPEVLHVEHGGEVLK